MRGEAPVPNAATRFIFHISGAASGPLDSLRPIIAELEGHGFPPMLVHSSVKGSDTPNEDRASTVVKAFQHLAGHSLSGVRVASNKFWLSQRPWAVIEL